jgi:hypothetical protein
MTRWLCAVVVGSAVLVAGCGGSSGGQSRVVAGHPPTVVRLDDTSNGRTVDAHVGDTVTVTLHSTYWTIAAPTGSALATSADPKPSPGGTACPHIPGSGCGTVTASYRAGSAGTSTLSAHRDSCGEALRCTPGAGDWTVTVKVS